MKTITQAAADYAAQERETRSEHAAFAAGAEWMREQIKTQKRRVPVKEKPSDALRQYP
jgi:hypothetical protein